MTPGKYKPVIEDYKHKHKDSWSLVRTISINAYGKEWLMTYPPVPITPESAPTESAPITYEPPPTIPDGELHYLKTLCERMAYYCDNAHFDGYDVTLAELYNLLDYYLANSMLWPLGPSES